MKSEQKSRRSMEKTNVDHKKEADKRLKETETLVKNKHIEADTAERINLSGTSEGAKAVKKGVTEAAKATEKKFGQDKGTYTKENVGEQVKTEEDLSKRSDTTGQDIKQLEEAKQKLGSNEATGQISDAASAAKDDKQFIDQSKKKAETDRKEGQKRMEQQESEIKGMSISFRG